MNDTFSFTLESPLTKEQLNLITDAEFEHTDRIWFDTPKGKHVEFVKAPQWNSCSERLPSDGDYDETFIVTIQCEHYDGWDDYVTGYADWTPHGWDIQSYYLGQIKVVAWMPLPDAYREGEQE